MERNNETKNVNEHNMVKNTNGQETDQFGVYMHGRGIEPSATKDNSCLWTGQDLDP